MSDIEPIRCATDTMSDLELYQLYEEDDLHNLLGPTVSEDSTDSDLLALEMLREESPSFDLSPFPITKSSDNEVTLRNGPSRHSGRKNKPTKAKRPQSAFGVFFKERKAQIDQQIAFERIGNMIASQWHNLSPEERASYERKARRNFRDYRKNMRKHKDKHTQPTASKSNLSFIQSPDLFTTGSDPSTKNLVEPIATPSPVHASLNKAEPGSPATPVKHLVTPVTPIRPHASPARAALPEHLLPVGLSHTQRVSPPPFYSKRFGSSGPPVSPSLSSPRVPLLGSPVRASLPGYSLQVPSFDHIGQPSRPPPYYYPQACSSSRPAQSVVMPPPIFRPPSRAAVPEGQEVVLPDKNGHPKRYRVQYKCVRMSRAEADAYMARSWQPQPLPRASQGPQH